MKCPKCAGEMEQVTLGDPTTDGPQTVDRCAACGGMWFDNVEHEHLARSEALAGQVDRGADMQTAALNAKRDIRCPACDVRMIPMSVPKQPHIQFERCPVCHGSYFDAGELRDLSQLTVSEWATNLFAGFRRR